MTLMNTLRYYTLLFSATITLLANLEAPFIFLKKKKIQVASILQSRVTRESIEVKLHYGNEIISTYPTLSVY